MTTFSDSDEITGNELETVQSTDEEETGADELAEELLAVEESDIDGGEIQEKIEGIEDDIEELKGEEEVAMKGEMTKVEDELNKGEEKLGEAESDLEDDVAGFVGV